MNFRKKLKNILIIKNLNKKKKEKIFILNINNKKKIYKNIINKYILIFI
jgi:hypothetical protein